MEKSEAVEEPEAVEKPASVEEPDNIEKPELEYMNMKNQKKNETSTDDLSDAEYVFQLVKENGISTDHANNFFDFLGEKIRIQDKEIESLNEVIDKREKQLDDELNEIKDLEYELREKDEEMKQASKRIEIQGNVIHELKSQNKQKDETINEMIDERNIAKKEIQNFKIQIRNLFAEDSSGTTEIDYINLKTEIESIKSELKEKEHIIKGLKNTVDHCELTNSELESENLKLHDEILRIKQETFKIEQQLKKVVLDVEKKVKKNEHTSPCENCEKTIQNKPAPKVHIDASTQNEETGPWDPGIQTICLVENYMFLVYLL